MKHTITIALLLFAYFATAQDATLDTTYFSTVNGVLFAIERVEYADGSYNERRYPTDTTRVVNTTNQNTLNQMSEFVAIAKRWQNVRRLTSLEVRKGDAIRAAIGINPREVLIDGYASETIDTSYTWQAVTATSTRNCTFTKAASTKDLRFNDGTGVRNFFVLGEIARVVNWPASGNITIVYKASPTLWQDIRGENKFVGTPKR